MSLVPLPGGGAMSAREIIGTIAIGALIGLWAAVVLSIGVLTFLVLA